MKHLKHTKHKGFRCPKNAQHFLGKRGSFLTEHLGKMIWFVVILLVLGAMVILFGGLMAEKFEWVKEVLFYR